jgi:hypothetical protein
MTRRSRIVVLMNRLSPRRLVSLAVTLAIVSIPAVVTALTAAPICTKSCLPGV